MRQEIIDEAVELAGGAEDMLPADDDLSRNNSGEALSGEVLQHDAQNDQIMSAGPFQCQECKKMLKTKPGYRNHILLHKTKRKFHQILL